MRVPPASKVELKADERVWVTGDVHLSPGDPERAGFFVRFLEAARRECDRLVILGDLFDFWIGPRHALGCAYGPVVEALRAAHAAGFPLEFLCGNRDFLGPRELEAIGLRVHGDLLLLERPGGARTLVTHGDLLVEGDHAYRRYRRAVRSWWFHLGYRVVPVWFRLFVARLLRGASQRKLSRVTPYAYPIDLATSQSWLAAHEARELLMGHLHRAEHHAHPGGGATRMLAGWSAAAGPYFLLAGLAGQGAAGAELRAFPEGN